MKEKISEKRTVELSKPTALFMDALTLANEALTKALEANELLTEEIASNQSIQLNTEVLEGHNAFQDAIWKYMCESMHLALLDQFCEGQAFKQI